MLLHYVSDIFEQQIQILSMMHKTQMTITAQFCTQFCHLFLCFSAVTLLFGHQKDHPPVKKLSDRVLMWLSVWREVHMICIWSSWCHCHPSSLASVNSRMVYVSGAGLTRLPRKKGC